MRVWALRIVWVTLPVTAGPAIADGLRAWGGAPRVVGAVLCWLAWGVGLVATLAPRPLGLTALRTLAPAGVVLGVVVAATGHASTVAAVGALAATVAAAALVALPAIARAAGDGVAYGDERRYPLRVPPALYLGPLPLARAAVVAGIVAGPLLLADGDVVVGVLAVLAAAVVVPLAGRALHGLSRRWLILVPAGVVVADRMALAENFLFPREHLRIVRAARPDEPPGDALDLRFGATNGSVLLVFDEPAELTRAARARRGGTTVKAPGVVIAVADRHGMLEAAAQRRVLVEADAPPRRG